MALLSAVTYFTARTIWTGAVQCVDLVWLAVSVHHFSLVLCLSIFHSLTESLCPSSLWGKYDVQEADCNGAEGFFYCITQLHAVALWIVGARPGLPSEDCFHSNLAVQRCLHKT